MTDYADLIKRAAPYYNDLPVEGMKFLDEMVNAIRDLAAERNELQSQLKEWQDDYTVLRDRHADIQSKLAEARKSLEPYLEAAARYAEGLNAKLDEPSWKPNRAHVEQARNTIHRLVGTVRSAFPDSTGKFR